VFLASLASFDGKYNEIQRLFVCVCFPKKPSIALLHLPNQLDCGSPLKKYSSIVNHRIIVGKLVAQSALG
jgi:exoribonuclease II